MKKTKKKYFDNLKLDKEEKRIEAALSKGEFVVVPDLEEAKKMLKKAAENY